jgi:hypothetical protein
MDVGAWALMLANKRPPVTKVVFPQQLGHGLP